jgi:hypothetical protein
MRIGFGHGVSPLNLRFLNPPNLHAFRFRRESGSIFGGLRLRSAGGDESGTPFHEFKAVL